MSKLNNGVWRLSDIENMKKNNLNVFSCFHCGGGSTMGYKLSGFNVLGGVEIDPEMMKIYRKNHNPKHSFLMGVQDFNKITDEKLSTDLFNLDILDGSPPCSSFSMAGSREKAWGEKKKFREGQANQVLDDLFFEYINIAKKLKPKVVVAENVKGLVMGKAKGYVKMIFENFDKAGYETQLFLLNGAFMGIPQKRERTFFIARRKDLNLPKLNLSFNENIISAKKAFEHISYDQNYKKLTQETQKLWSLTKAGDSLSKVHLTGARFNAIKLSSEFPSNTITASGEMFHWKYPRHLIESEFLALQTFPIDFDFQGVAGKYVMGMSVPPFMMQRVSNQIAHQLFKKELLT